ncbi:creatininase family protein [Oceanicella sp. SM1341]|uniref:creatininase family protein n=1 Tax=Oceanicella sp. SM1341 TaxID=1548889 RepID=UPI000E497FE8|nr:creatininase family protein [Oceanicella sp. SM1341]
MPMPRHYWAQYRTTEFAGFDPARTIAVLPTAAIEQHGPHLPVGVDSMIGQGMLDTLTGLLDAAEDIRVLILPLQCVGKSNEHLHAPGTVTLTAATAIEAWTEIGLSVARAGLRKMAIVNSHGGNVDMNSIIARELRVRANMLVGKAHWGAFGTPEGMFSPREKTYGIHGGDVETSLMLHFRPELVEMAEAQNFTSTAEGMGNFTHLRPTGPTSYGWIASDLNPHGTVGEAALATAEKGAATARHQAEGFLAFLRELAEFELPGL